MTIRTKRLGFVRLTPINYPTTRLNMLFVNCPILLYSLVTILIYPSIVSAQCEDLSYGQVLQIFKEFKRDNPNVELENYPWPRACGASGYGGENVQPGDIPYIVDVHINGIHQCGGVILDRKIILSAAHCFVDSAGIVNKDTVKIIAGQYNQAAVDCSEQSVGLEGIHPHPLYNRNTLKNDIVILLLDNPLDFSMDINKIQFGAHPCELSRDYKEECIAEAAGWGFTQTGQSSNILQKVHLRYMPDDFCKLHGEFGDSQICGYGGLGRDTCRGDSGGPLLCHPFIRNEFREGILKYPPPFLCGIVSFGKAKCVTKAPAVYTKVSYYSNWIHWHLRRHSVPENLDNNRVTYENYSCYFSSGHPVFRCDNGKSIFYEYRCDSEDDCLDQSDEVDCLPINKFKCKNGKAIAYQRRCDYTNDCGDWSDEVGCEGRNCGDSLTRRFSCLNSKNECIESSGLCDGISHCFDNGRDESGCSPCKTNQYRCSNKQKCIDSELVCNGEVDCAQGEDEDNCSDSYSSAPARIIFSN